MVLHVNGAADPHSSERPILRVEVWDFDDEKKDELVGVVDIDLLALAADASRASRVSAMEKELEAEISELQRGTVDEKVLEQASARLKHLKEKKRAVQRNLEGWYNMKWLPSCGEEFKALDPNGNECVRGADAQLACVKLSFKCHLSEYHQNCYINHQDAFVRVMLDSLRGQIGSAADEALTVLTNHSHIMRETFLHDSGKCAVSDVSLEAMGVWQSYVRKAILTCLDRADDSFIRFCGLKGGTPPGLPLRLDAELPVGTDRDLANSVHDWKEFTKGGSPLKLHLSGEITVHLVKGLHLPKMDKVGSCDPYLKVIVGDCEACSSAKFNTLNPKWDEDIVCEVKDPKHELSVSLWDVDELKILDIKIKKVGAWSGCHARSACFTPQRLKDTQLLSADTRWVCFASQSPHNFLRQYLCEWRRNEIRR